MNEPAPTKIRLDRRLLAEIDELAAVEHADRSEMARRLLRLGIANQRRDLAVREYRDGRVSAWRAAEMAGLSLWDMVDLIRQEGMPYELDPAVLGRLRGA